jgi:hypothetical protein
LFLPDGTLKNCPRHFVQLHSLHVALGSTSHNNNNNNLYPVPFALLPDKTEKSISLLENSPEELMFFLADFEAAVIRAIRKSFSDSVITGYNFHCSQCLYRNL